MVDALEEPTRGRRSALGLRRRGDQLGPQRPGPSGRPWPSGQHGEEATALREIDRAYGALRLDDRYPRARPPRASPGVCCIAETRPMALAGLPQASRAREVLLGCLETVCGIGPALAGRLRQAGVTSVLQLADDARFGGAAAEVLLEWDAGDLGAICWRLTRRLGERGHLLSTLICSVVGIDQVAFFDLETTGLGNNVVFLAGVGRARAGSFTVSQFLALSFADEAAVIAHALEQLADAQVVVSFNGCSADMTWLVNRAFYHGIGPLPRFLHVDLLYGTRRRFGRGQGGLSDVRLPTVSERLLGQPRPEGDLPGWLIPHLYHHYARRPARREGLLVPILDHNQADLAVLAGLLEMLCEEAQACQ